MSLRIALLCAVLSRAAPALPGCFAPDAPETIEGRWWPAADAPPEVRAFAQGYQAAVRAPGCAERLRRTGNAARTCGATR